MGNSKKINLKNKNISIIGMGETGQGAALLAKKLGANVLLSDSNKRIECDILFEGGIVDRDNCWWMKEFNKKPMNALKDKLNYRTLNKNYPGISLIERNR